MKTCQLAGFFLLPFLLATARPAHPAHTRPVLRRQEDSGTDYTGYTLEGCDNMFASCKGHLAHPGHAPGGMKQCQSEMSRFARGLFLQCNKTLERKDAGG